MMERNIFFYHNEQECKLTLILKNLIYLHSANGKGYNVHLITDSNVNEYISDFPELFKKITLDQKIDFLKVHIICERGGIWLDKNTIVLDKLDALFDTIENKEGFFIKIDSSKIYSGVFGSQKQTPLMNKWKNTMIDTLFKNIDNTISEVFQNICNGTPFLYEKYELYNGCDSLIPVNFKDCLNEFYEKPYENHQSISRSYQPLICLDNSICKYFENLSLKEMFKNISPIHYFINKSFENMTLLDYDFIEIGTCNFDTLIENSDDNTRGISVDAVKHYVDSLPEKKNVKKINAGISDVKTKIDVYYIPEETITKCQMHTWVKGCTCIGRYHPVIIENKLTHLCKVEKVDVIPTRELFYTNNVRKLKLIKTDTEGHDCIILKDLHQYIQFLPDNFYPEKILFESNEWSKKEHVDFIIYLFCSLGYSLEHRSSETILIYKK